MATLKQIVETGPTEPCALCGELSLDGDLLDRYDARARVCTSCGEAVANAWWKSRFGAWLTWINPNGKRPAFKKAPISAELCRQVFERDAYRCRHCNGWLDLTVDHIVPESVGGTTVSENLQTLCRSCNSVKGVSLQPE